MIRATRLSMLFLGLLLSLTTSPGVHAQHWSLDPISSARARDNLPVRRWVDERRADIDWSRCPLPLDYRVYGGGLPDGVPEQFASPWPVPPQAWPPTPSTARSPQPSAVQAPEAPTGPTPPSAEQTGTSQYFASAYSEPTLGGEGLPPNMIGDFFGIGGDLQTNNPVQATAPIPLAGGSRRVKVAENNSPLTQDRVFFLHNHFHNVYAAEMNPRTGGTGERRVFSVDRYTIGLEKILFCQSWSVEVRMPFTGRTDFQTQDFSITGGQIGNLAVLFKNVLHEDARRVLTAGLGIDTPTGCDATGHVSDSLHHTDYTVHNEAVHLLPFIGFLSTPNNQFFFQAFVQADVPVSGNTITYSYNNGASSGTFGVLDEQSLLYADVGAGYWLPCSLFACCFTRLAGIVEFHYTTTLEDADSVIDNSLPATDFNFGNSANRMDIPNLTAGLHCEITNCTLLRVAGVFPLKDDDDRFFDAEVQVQVEQRF